MIRLFATVALALGFQAFGAADYALIKDLVGKYPVIEMNGNYTIGGVAEIVANDSGVGYELSAIPMAGNPASAQSYITAKEPTILVKNADVLVQDFRTNSNSVRVEYKVVTGYLEINAESCSGGSACVKTHLTLSQGRAPGVQVETAKFMEARRGEYEIVMAAGAEPHSEDSKFASILPASKPNEEEFTMPFCMPEQPCPAPWINFPYADTQIFRTTNVGGGDIYTIILTRKGKVKHYSWEDGATTSTFRNFQFVLPDTRVVAVDYVLKKK